jgi:3-deoxy-D-manno-octulosonic-acid transferase
MYTFAIAFYALAVRLIAPFHKKARKMLTGQRNTFRILRKNIQPDAPYIWFHAASLGEFEQGRPLMERIREQRPEYRILLTFFSPSGYEVRKNYEGADVVCYLPFDLPHHVRRFLQLVNPAMAIFIKYEFWMNYLTALDRQQVPTYIISAVFRPHQIFFRWYAKRYKRVLNTFDRLYVQDAASADLLAENGINNVVTCGDTRFDRVLDIHARSKELPLLEAFTTDAQGKKIFTMVAGSSWPKDEEIFIPRFNKSPEMKLIIAPHEIHEGHLQEIISRLKRPYVLYTEASEENVRKADCLIIDCFGLLSSSYRYGEISYVGGGFGAGIHNVPEAAVYDIPVIFGPNFNKFREARELIRCGGGFSIHDANGFNEIMNILTTSTEALTNAGKNAGDYVNSNGGATERIFGEIFPNDK